MKCKNCLGNGVIHTCCPECKGTGKERARPKEIEIAIAEAIDRVIGTSPRMKTFDGMKLPALTVRQEDILLILDGLTTYRDKLDAAELLDSIRRLRSHLLTCRKDQQRIEASPSRVRFAHEAKGRRLEIEHVISHLDPILEAHECGEKGGSPTK